MNGLLGWRPLVLADLFEWIESGLNGLGVPTGTGGAHGIRVEETLAQDAYVVRAELPGLDAERDVRVDINEGVLHVRAERTEETREKHRTEFRYGSLRRSVRLPRGARESAAEARYEHGILTVTVPLATTVEAVTTVPVRDAAS
ncbi:Hsp20/alpha crystallin family protein [Streptomyces sp. NRRL B-1347]|uniref:Hsp20/alpha crystallin family protein n=1 Tax=Streptomyces sp. NRRL B-1347 TaxID=1476877 RepID=UPI0004C5DBB3|nr:Hsp20/alpha crystallin family protein [Streptomyces sp. NRRL B-1347]